MTPDKTVHAHWLSHWTAIHNVLLLLPYGKLSDTYLSERRNDGGTHHVEIDYHGRNFVFRHNFREALWRTAKQ